MIYNIINNSIICIFDNKTQMKNKMENIKSLVKKYNASKVNKVEYVTVDYINTLSNMYLFDFRENQSNRRIKDWYISNYPCDELGKEINNTVTFHQFMECLKKGEDYTRISGKKLDSLIYDRIAGRLCEIYHISGSEISDMFFKIICKR